MNTSKTQLQTKRAAWLAKHPFKLGMSLEKTLKLNEELIRLYPLTLAERKQRSTHVDMEFVL